VKVLGEFEKRIILMIGEGKYDAQRVEYLGEVSDMIEEAKKEFPLWIAQPLQVFWSKHIKPEEYEQLDLLSITELEKIMKALKEWFLKYFGG